MISYGNTIRDGLAKRARLPRDPVVVLENPIRGDSCLKENQGSIICECLHSSICLQWDGARLVTRVKSATGTGSISRFRLRLEAQR